MIRDWTEARAKVDNEGACRVCGITGRIEAAHVIGRTHDSPEPLIHKLGYLLDARDHLVEVEWGQTAIIDPNDIVPLCGPATSTGTCHGRYDAHALDLLVYLTPAEQLAAVARAGNIFAAYRRISGRRGEPTDTTDLIPF